MRSSILLVPLLAAGCFEGEVADFGCPADEVCSPDTPDGLHFFGADLAGVFEIDNFPIAVGGIQRVRLAREVGDTFVDLDAGYLALDTGPSILVEDQDGPVVTLRAAAAGSNHLEIRDADDNSLMDRKVFESAELASISITDTGYEGSERPIAFMPGTIRFGIALTDADGDRLVDEGMTLDLPGATHVTWDILELSGTTAGTISVSVTAAGKPPATVDVVVVPAVEAIALDLAPEPLVVGSTSFACFEAHAGEHFVAGLTWAFTTDNGQVQEFVSPSCITVVPDTAGDITITASAGGIEKVVTFPVAEAQAKPSRVASPLRVIDRLRGERATAAAASLSR